MLETGKLSHRKISRLTGVSRGTIDGISNGTRKLKDRNGRSNLSEDALELYLASQDIPKRCQECGAKVVLPCRHCAARAFAAKNKKRPSDRGPPIILGLELKPEHKARYKEVRRARCEASQPAGVVQEVQAGPKIRRRRRENFQGSIDGCFDRIDFTGGINQ